MEKRLTHDGKILAVGGADVHSDRDFSQARNPPHDGFAAATLVASNSLFFCCFLFPAIAFAQSGSPFDTGFTALQNLFTGTVAKVASLLAIVIGGYQFAHGEPGSKKALAGVAAGSGTLVNIKFQGIAAGTPEIALTKITLLDSHLNPIVVDDTPAQVTTTVALNTAEVRSPGFSLTSPDGQPLIGQAAVAAVALDRSAA